MQSVSFMVCGVGCREDRWAGKVLVYGEHPRLAETDPRKAGQEPGWFVLESHGLRQTKIRITDVNSLCKPQNTLPGMF